MTEQHLGIISAIEDVYLNILSSFATMPCLNSIEDFTHEQVDDLVISTLASLCSNLDPVAPVKKKVIKQRNLVLCYNSQIHALKQTSWKLERKWRSGNSEDFHLAWKQN